ncbi:LysR family transcriptional regulator [Streptomyces sp. NPDC003011]
MVLDVWKLMLLREVEARGSIAAAAEALNYTRSAVSHQLSALEAETGTELVDRSRRRAGLTAAGRLLVGHTERILASLETAESELAAVTRRVHGELRVGVPFHEGPALLVPALTRVRAAHPELRITLQGLPAADCREAVRLGQVDLVLAVGYDQVPEPPVAGLYEEPVADDRVRLAVGPQEGPADAPIDASADEPIDEPIDEPASAPADEPAGALARYADRPWILDPSSGLGRLALHACAAAGYAPDVVARTSDPHATLGLVSLGWGVSLVPDLVPDRPGYPVRRIALEGPELMRRVSVVVRQGTLARPDVAAVLSEVRASAGRLGQDGVRGARSAR